MADAAGGDHELDRADYFDRDGRGGGGDFDCALSADFEFGWAVGGKI